MVGMLQILTYMFAFYLVLKALEILQVGVASSRENRSGMIMWGCILVLICVAAAFVFVAQQDSMAGRISAGMSHMP